MTQSFINPLSKFTSDTLTTLPYSRLYFFENESSTPKEVFKNKEKTVSWGYYATADSAGNFPPIWFDGVVRAELRYSSNWATNPTGTVQTGWPIDHIGSDVSFDTDVTINGDLTADNLISLGAVEADTASGFITTDYTLNARNPIWSFGNANGYGISYFAGTPSLGNGDYIGLHFGTATQLGSEFLFKDDGRFSAANVSIDGDLIFTDGGVVGINKPAPAATLDVGGTILADNNIQAGGSVSCSSGFFPGNNNAALNHYYTGTFVPSVSGTAVAGSATYAIQEARYTRIGNVVFFAISVQWSGHTGSGDIRISGLPYSVAGTNLRYAAPVAYSSYVVGAGLELVASVNQNYVYFYACDPTGVAAYDLVDIDAAGRIDVAGMYFTS